MSDRQALFDQLLEYLQSTPSLPEYLDAEPDAAATFDPYQLVSEWIALRQEMKQQGKVLQAAQEQLQRELDTARSHNEQLQQRLDTAQKQASALCATELVAQEKRFEKAQEGLLRGLLNVLDALDRACAHWSEQSLPQAVERPPTLKEQVAGWLIQLGQKLASSVAAPASSASALTEILSSDRAGIELIRRNLLNLLEQQQVIPIAAQGQAFDPQCMYAIGRQPSDAPENTVIQEVVRGYLRSDHAEGGTASHRVLREAQVIVSAGNPTS